MKVCSDKLSNKKKFMGVPSKRPIFIGLNDIKKKQKRPLKNVLKRGLKTPLKRLFFRTFTESLLGSPLCSKMGIK